ncbi:DUF4270 domain-containing protein [Winogradskyella wichelsiae]|uniref:DUF4270 domain-containing protein n=1 Tax=Winogradskyella wichelsiae TaxID=2697007 RepID=UPI0015C77C1E|nr:DUF4270 domain-containing protein [Winogradskyella wichelsiae]
MKKNKIILQLIAFSLIIISFIACESDFADLESDVLNSDIATTFDTDSDQYDVITYTKALNPVQTNNLILNTLGVYDDAYGRTTSSFVTQLTPSTYSPDFGDEVIVDSVVVTLPFFSTATGTDTDGNLTYTIDSVISTGDSYNDIKLRIFENNYFLRNFDPSGDFGESQAYYSNKTASSSEIISEGALEGTELDFLAAQETSHTADTNIINISEEVYVLETADTEDDDTDTVVTERQAPGIRIKLDPTFWEQKIIAKEGDPVLSNENNFLNYFRGLYFKAEAVDNKGSFMYLNTSSGNNANVTIYYSKLTASTTDEADARDNATYVLNLATNKVNFQVNDFTLPINEGDSDNGDSRLYLKGGEGAVAGIKLFDGVDDETGLSNFDKFRNKFVNLENNEYTSSKRLVNEANLIFYVDRDQLDILGEDPENEPDRIYLYDVANNRPLTDYDNDFTNSISPSFSKTNHLGRLERVDGENDGKGIKYKLKITEHINNLLLRDSTNVELGLAVSMNVNLEGAFLQNKIQNSDDSNSTLPISSILSPRGTILHGNNTSDESKRVYLEIYYTEPN